MVPRSLLFSSVFLHLASSWGRENEKPGTLRRNETPTYPSDPNTTKYYTWWWDNDGSISCADMPAAWSLDPDDFRRWNPPIDAACVGIEIGGSYCVEAWGEPPSPSITVVASSAALTSSSTPVAVSTPVDVSSTSESPSAGLPPTFTTTTPAAPATNTVEGNGIFTPTPIQPDLAQSCDKFHFLVLGNDCWNIAVKYSIAMTDVVDWNSSVNRACSGLWGVVYMCVGLIKDVATTSVESATTSLNLLTTTTAPGDGITTPIPTQPGMVLNCAKFHLVVPGDGCWNIAAKYSIAIFDVVALNPGVKSDCSGLWLAVNVCISAIKDVTTTSTKSATSWYIYQLQDIHEGGVERYVRHHCDEGKNHVGELL